METENTHNNVSPADAPPELIITTNDMRYPLLASQSLPCNLPLSIEDQEVVQRMKELISSMGREAVGLAGVQIGLMRRVFVMKCINNRIIECINPVILQTSVEKSNKPEGCLSIPKLYVNIKRAKRVRLGYYDILGSYHVEDFIGLDAKVICHEMDHLNGRTIAFHAEREYDRKDNLAQEAKRVKKMKKEKRRRLAKLRK